MGSIHTFSDQQAAEALRSNPGMIPSSDDPTEATAQTVEYMCQLINDSLADGIVTRACRDAWKFSGRVDVGTWTPVEVRAECIWWFAKHTIKFVHHQKLLVSWLGAPNELQLLIRPDALLKMREPKGDCAVFTTLICAMLDCAGIPWEIVTIACDPRQPGIYSHVYPRVVLPDGRRLVMDASHGKYPGWEVPAEHTTAKQIWNQDGQPVDDEAPRFSGLHGYRMPGEGSGRRGLGDDNGDDDLTGLDVSSLDPNAGPTLGTGGGTGISNINCGAGQIFEPISGDCFTPSPLPSGSSSSVSSAAFGASSLAADLNALFSGGTQLARTALGLPATTTTTSTNTNSLLLIGALVVGGIVLVSAFSGKGKR